MLSAYSHHWSAPLYRKVLLKSSSRHHHCSLGPGWWSQPFYLPDRPSLWSVSDCLSGRGKQSSKCMGNCHGQIPVPSRFNQSGLLDQCDIMLKCQCHDIGVTSLHNGTRLCTGTSVGLNNIHFFSRFFLIIFSQTEDYMLHKILLSDRRRRWWLSVHDFFCFRIRYIQSTELLPWTVPLFSLPLKMIFASCFRLPWLSFIIPLNSYHVNRYCRNNFPFFL